MKKETRICINPECGEPFDTTNPKKFNCNISCKNRGAYLRSLIDFRLERSIYKAFIKNIRIVKDLFERGFKKVTCETLNMVGFDDNLGIIPEKDKFGRSYFIYGKIALLLVSPEEYELYLINQK